MPTSALFSALRTIHKWADVGIRPYKYAEGVFRDLYRQHRSRGPKDEKTTARVRNALAAGLARRSQII